MGPVISDSARKTILKYIETGKQEGRLVAGDAAPEGGYFIPPTIIADVDSEARIFQEEIFGPVLAVTKAKDFEHALELANDSQYGLTGAVFSNNPEHLEQAKRALLTSAICTSIANAPARWWEPTPLAASTCRAPIRRPADRTTCCYSYRRNRSPRRSDRTHDYGRPSPAAGVLPVTSASKSAPKISVACGFGSRSGS